ncbi:MAG: hypothetical protein E6K54_02880 [Gammaproteobacteria bacterium]|nr:MAG: hypothetical protein E6K54_02880 [Gammaproteobacteria bacterium]
MNFPNLSTFIAQGLSISAAFFGFKPDNAEFTCPSTKDINEKIKTGERMVFPVEGISGDGFETRNANNQRVEHYNNMTRIKKLNTVYFQTAQVGRNASVNCDYIDSRGIRFSLVGLPETVGRIDATKINKISWSGFFGNGLKDCGYSKMPEEIIREECSFTMKNK